MGVRGMGNDRKIGRRSFLARAGAGAAVVLGGGLETLARMTPAMAAPTGQLYNAAKAKGILFGSSTATWQYEPDPAGGRG